MNAQELADYFEYELKDVFPYYTLTIQMLRQLAELQKPLTDEEINEIKTLMEINYGCVPPLEFAWAIEERHGIK